MALSFEKVEKLLLNHSFDFSLEPVEHAVPFGDISRLQDSAATIKIIERSHDNTVSEAFTAAHTEISKAHYIFILGFGFDWLNCERLAIADHRRGDARVYATAYGIGRSSMDDVQVLMGLDESVCTLYAASCRELFDNYRSLPTR